MLTPHEEIFAFDVAIHDEVPKHRRVEDLDQNHMFSNEFFGALHVVQVGWANGKVCDKLPAVVERLVRPDGFVIAQAAAHRHKITQAQAAANGSPIADVLTQLFCAARAAHIRGALFTSFNADFDTGMVRSELRRAGFYAEAHEWDVFTANRLDTMDHRIGKWVMSFTLGGDKGLLTLGETAAALVPADEVSLCKARHQAGADAQLHWFLCKSLLQRVADEKASRLS